MLPLDKPPPLSSTWLDALPEEISDHIAEFVTDGEKNFDALNLASVSEKQTRSVARSFSYPFFADLEDQHRIDPFQRDEDIIRWTHVFADYPFDVMTSRGTPFALKILREANLGDALVHIQADSNEIVDALRMQSQLPKLTIVLSPGADIEMVADMLSSLSLKQLTLCEERSFDDLVLFAKAAARFMESCDPSAQLIWMTGNALRDPSRSYWDAVALLPNPTLIHITAIPPEGLYAKISQFSSVKLAGVPTSVAARIGENVTRFSQSYCAQLYDPDTMLDCDEVVKLENCPQISDLSIFVFQSAESAVAKLITKLHCLKSLTLYWKHDFEEDDTDSIVDLTPGVMSSALRKSTMLEILEIRDTYIPTKEWEHVLAKIGGTLTYLTIHVDIADAELYKLALEMVSLVSKYCGNMEGLTISSSKMPAEDVTEDLKIKLRHALRKLQMTHPKFDGLHLIPGDEYDDDGTEEEEGSENNDGEEVEDDSDDESSEEED